jgi:hypothetical protein
MFNSALGTRDHPSLRIAMDRVEVHQVSSRGLLRGNLLITNRPRNRRIAEEKYDTADSQLPDKDLDDKQDIFARVVSVGDDGRK